MTRSSYPSENVQNVQHHRIFMFHLDGTGVDFSKDWKGVGRFSSSIMETDSLCLMATSVDYLTSFVKCQRRPSNVRWRMSDQEVCSGGVTLRQARILFIEIILANRLKVL